MAPQQRNPGTIRAVLLVVLPLILGVLGGYVACAEQHQRQKPSYAAVWSGRTDRAIEYRLESNPEARYLVLLPDHYDPHKRYTLWVSLHGRSGGAEEGLKEWYYYAKRRDVILLAPHGSRQLHTKQPEIKHWAYWHFEQDPDDIAKIIHEVIGRYNIDPNTIALFGTSVGGEVALSVASRLSTHVGFIGLYGLSWSNAQIDQDHVLAQSLREHASSIPMFVGRGLADPQTPLSSFQQSVDSLRQLGFRPNVMLWPKLEHDDRDWRKATLRYYDGLRGKSPSEPLLVASLVGTWRAKFVNRIPAEAICHDDPGVSPQALAAVQSSYNDSHWQNVGVPMWRTKWAGDWSGDKWSGETVMRKTINVSPRFAGRSLTIDLALFESLDTCFFNGVQVGKTTADDQYWLWKPREYTVPAQLVKAGANIVAVRFFDRCGGGGITFAGPDELQVSCP